MSSVEPIRILFVSANPARTETLASDVEARQIREALGKSKFGERFDLDTAPATRIGDLSSLLRDHQPHILHIAVHGTLDGGLTFNALDDWEGQTLAAENLAGIVAAYQAEATQKLRLVVLAGCGTAKAAQLVSRHMDCAIGTNGDVTDSAVIRLSPDLYAALGDGRSVGNAFDSALAELRGHGMNSDADLFELYPRAGVDPHKLILTALTTTQLTPAHLDYSAPLVWQAVGHRQSGRHLPAPGAGQPAGCLCAPACRFQTGHRSRRSSDCRLVGASGQPRKP